MKKNISAMICYQTTSAKHASSKNAMALVQFKLDAAMKPLLLRIVKSIGPALRN
jgi:hypothetical protein